MARGARIAGVQLHIDQWVRLAEAREARNEQLVRKQRRQPHAQRLPAAAARQPRQRTVERLEQRLDFLQQPQTHGGQRSEEHTSELQSLAYLVCRLLLE